MVTGGEDDKEGCSFHLINSDNVCTCACVNVA